MSANFLQPTIHLPKLLLGIGGIYTTQTIITSLVTQALPTLLRQAGIPLDIIGLTSLLWLPWCLRILWAAKIEQFRLSSLSPTQRSFQIIGWGQWSIAFLFWGLSISPFSLFSLSDIYWILGVLLLAACLSASIDIVCDGLMINQLLPQQRSWGNTIQVSANYLGATLGSGFFLMVVARYGWFNALWVMGIIIATLSLPIILKRSQQSSSQPLSPPSSFSNPQPSLRKALNNPLIRKGIIFLLLSSIGIRLSLGMLGPMLIDKGMSLEHVGKIFGIFFILAGILGSLLGGLLLQRYPNWRGTALLITFMGICLTTLSLAIHHNSSLTVITLIIGLIFVAMSSMWVGLYSSLMNIVSPSQAGVDFTIFQSTDAALAIAAGIIGGWLSQYLGYVTCFILAAITTFTAALFLYKNSTTHQQG